MFVCFSSLLLVFFMSTVPSLIVATVGLQIWLPIAITMTMLPADIPVLVPFIFTDILSLVFLMSFV